MKSFIKIFLVSITITLSTTSCVSSYVARNDGYLTTEALLAHRTNYSKSSIEAESKNFNESSSSVFEEETSEKSYSQEAYKLIGEAKTYLGTPYRYGGTTRSGIDCSSFVQHAFNALNISLPRTSILQSNEGKIVKKDQLKKGDLIFFAQSPKSRISHVGIVERVEPDGEIYFIHASSSKGVTISSLEGEYWKKRYRTAKRILESNNNLDNIETQNIHSDLAKVSS
ncbi:NlpC/P60 family protein [Apibacter muscae]|uniref:NlpC/P60 family protein n=1 Tax=Apibacter muscae TaxID=2509004 RepID=A0A563DGY0_9FLAO|nr:C40 family peptidase [Apibacter muscae]TWP29322.1 NlpC/P60 family protein [Apibacter muscae]